MKDFLQNQVDKVTDYTQDKFIEVGLTILKGIGNFVISTADITCPIICLLALAFYISGNRKAGKFISGSFVFYFLSQALRMVLKCKV